MLRELQNRYIQHLNGHVVVEPQPSAGFEIDALYRDLAVYCIERQIRRVLVKLCDQDAASERALRAALTTMVLAGLPAEFRVALVAEDYHIAARYRTTERDLCNAGLDAKMFPTAEGATRWLGG
jgi:predicted GTPase